MPAAVRTGALLLGLLGAGLSGCTALFSFAPDGDGGTLERDSGDPDRDATTDGAPDAANRDAGACGTPTATTHPWNAVAVGRFDDFLLVGGARGLDRFSGTDLGTACGHWPLDEGSVRSIWVNDQGATHVTMTGGLMNDMAHVDASGPCIDEDGPSSTAFGSHGDYHEIYRDGDLYVAAGAMGVQRWNMPEGMPVPVYTYAPLPDDPQVVVTAITGTPDWVFGAAPSDGAILAIERSSNVISVVTTAGTEPNDVDSTPERLFIADGLQGLRVVTANADMEPMATVTADISAQRIEVDRGAAFVCGQDGAGGALVAFDVTSAEPDWLFSVTGLAGACTGIAVDDTNVFLANGAALEVVPRGCAAPRE